MAVLSNSEPLSIYPKKGQDSVNQGGIFVIELRDTAHSHPLGCSQSGSDPS